MPAHGKRNTHASPKSVKKALVKRRIFNRKTVQQNQVPRRKR